MNNSFEPSFIPETIEKTPFADTVAQTFFAQWCEINDSIVPEFMPRDKWEERRDQGILEKNDRGEQTLFLPSDLRLWEMVDIIETVDYDTLAKNPEKRTERADQIQELGHTFEKAGLYLAEYLPILKEVEGKVIAEEVAKEFYRYGLSLQKKRQQTSDLPTERSRSLSKEEKTKLDEWFLGTETYRRRLARLDENPTDKQIEDTRKKLLQGYFKALAREGYKADGEKPWETEVGPIQHLQDKTKKKIIEAIETPEREMKTAFFRRGVQKLVTEMKILGWEEAVKRFLTQGYNLDVATEKVKLSNSLELSRLKKELEEIRQTADVTRISYKELEIAKKIWKAVRSYPYRAVAGGKAVLIIHLVLLKHNLLTVLDLQY